MQTNDYETLLKQGIDSVESGDIHTALIYLNQAAKIRKTPLVQSYRAFCMAHGEGRVGSALKVCQQALNCERGNSVHYLILGRLLLMNGDRSRAIETFRKGLRMGRSPLIIKELKQLGLRRPVVISSLRRSNPINRMLGKTFSVIGLR